jgi:hypothetical protein
MYDSKDDGPDFGMQDGAALILDLGTLGDVVAVEAAPRYRCHHWWDDSFRCRPPAQQRSGSFLLPDVGARVHLGAHYMQVRRLVEDVSAAVYKTATA